MIRFRVIFTYPLMLMLFIRMYEVQSTPEKRLLFRVLSLLIYYLHAELTIRSLGKN